MAIDHAGRPCRDLVEQPLQESHEQRDAKSAWLIQYQSNGAAFDANLNAGEPPPGTTQTLSAALYYQNTSQSAPSITFTTCPKLPSPHACQPGN